jgi:iron complex outermembrane receptor protein
MMCLFHRWLPAALALAALAPMHALAQRADENAVTAADDAFGTKVGSQSIGLYDAEHVRGFSPRAASPADRRGNAAHRLATSRRRLSSKG